MGHMARDNAGNNVLHRISEDTRDWYRLGTLDEVADEMTRAEIKHGDYAFDGKLIDDLQLLAGILEEAGEVGRAMTYDRDHAGALRKELIQLAASATAWAATLSPETDTRTVHY